MACVFFWLRKSNENFVGKLVVYVCLMLVELRAAIHKQICQYLRSIKGFDEKLYFLFVLGRGEIYCGKQNFFNFNVVK